MSTINFLSSWNMCGCRYGVALTYYGISMNISGFGLNVYLTQFIYSAIEVPAKLMVYFLLRVIGRRTCQAGTLLVTGTCIGINIFLSKGCKSAFKIFPFIPFELFSSPWPNAFLVDLWHLRAAVAIIGKGSSEAAFTTVILYTTELYPTVIRSVASTRMRRMRLSSHCKIDSSVKCSLLSLSEATQAQNGQRIWPSKILQHCASLPPDKTLWATTASWVAWESQWLHWSCYWRTCGLFFLRSSSAL